MVCARDIRRCVKRSARSRLRRVSLHFFLMSDLNQRTANRFLEVGGIKIEASA